MLVQLKFDIDEMNRGSKEIGVTYTNDEETFGDTIISLIIGYGDPSHQYWHSKGETEPYPIYQMVEVEPGIYATCTGSLDFEFDNSTNIKCNDLHAYIDRAGNPISFREMHWGTRYRQPYGVADSIEQIKEHYKDLIENDKKYCITVSSVKKKDQPKSGGWRWYKWGEYIGTKTSNSEYLYDETDIDEVIIYHIYVVQEK